MSHSPKNDTNQWREIAQAYDGRRECVRVFRQDERSRAVENVEPDQVRAVGEAGVEDDGKG